VTRRLLLSACTLACVLGAAATAHGGTYTVSGQCGIWGPLHEQRRPRRRL